MILGKPEAELLVKSVKSKVSAPYLRTYVSKVDEGGDQCIVCLDGTNVVFVGEGEPRIPKFLNMLFIDMSFKAVIKAARDALPGCKYDKEFALTLSNITAPEGFRMSFHLNGGDHEMDFRPSPFSPSEFGIQDLHKIAGSLNIHHRIGHDSLAMMCQAAALKPKQPVKLFAETLGDTHFGACLVETENGFAGVVTVERT